MTAASSGIGRPGLASSVLNRDGVVRQHSHLSRQGVAVPFLRELLSGGAGDGGATEPRFPGAGDQSGPASSLSQTVAI